jgi:hypothetical protein
MPMQRVHWDQALTKAEFHARLRAWLRDDEARIDGGRDGDGRAPWVHVRDGHALYKLHADTKRQGVADYLALVRQHGDDLAWTVVASQSGKPSAVAYGPTAQKVRRFYLYVA